MTNATIQEIEGIDDYWGQAFRSIYEGEGHEAFMKQLDERIKQHDKDIERMCDFYYQGFIESIRDLLQVRSPAEELHADIVNMDANIMETAQILADRGDELIKARRVQLNMAATIEKMENCLPLLTTYMKLKSQVKAKRYYPALKTLEQLENVLLPRAGSFKFCEKISAEVPKLRRAIRDASMAELRDFLEHIRKVGPEVGALAQKQTQEMLGRNLENIVKMKRDRVVLGKDEEERIQKCPYELVDFRPLHRCMHIHTVLGAWSDFQDYYRTQRKQQARLVLTTATSNLHDNIQNIRNYLNAVLGFFILEAHITGWTRAPVSLAWLLDAWSMAMERVVSLLRTNTALITDVSLMLSVKHQVALFSSTLECYEMQTSPLHELLQEMTEHYTEVLMQRWVAVFRDILENELFQPIEVANQEQYEGVMDTFPYDGEQIEHLPFPKKFPFSSMVPAVYFQVKEFMYAWLKYSDGLGLTAESRAARARQSAALLLERSFTGCLSALFRKPSLALTQLVQIIIDTQYLEGATIYLHEFINNITGAEWSKGGVKAVGMFKVARKDAEKQICEKLEKKVDEFLDLENYDWLLVEPTGHASAFVTDMLSYLSGVLETLGHLPTGARVAAIRAATERIAKRLTAMLLDPKVKQISGGALHQLDLDVIQCEQFAASEPVPGLGEGQLLEYFASLRQLLDLFTSWDWSTYLHDVGMEGGKYSLVSPKDAAILLEKLKEAEQKSSVFGLLKKTERDRRKLLDTVLKQLRQLQLQQENAV